METSVITLNLDKICRVCLCEENQMYSIYSELYEENFEEEVPCIYEILISVSSIKIQADDGLPALICTKCIDSAHISFKFQKKCNRSQDILDTYITEYAVTCNIMKDVPSEEDPLLKDGFDELGSLNESILPESIASAENTFSSELLINTDLDPSHEDIKGVFVPAPSFDEALEQSSQIQVEPAVISDVLFSNENYVDCLNLEIEELESIKIHQNLGIIKTETNTISKSQKSLQTKIKNMKNYEKVMPSGNKMYACSLCDKSYKNGSSLRAHIRGHHNDYKPYTCGECGKGFKVYGSFFYHKRMHTGEQPHACKICGKKYKQSGTLTAHMRVHTGQKPFLCSICGRGFRQSPDLGYHMRTHTKEKPYMCNVCGKTMSMQSHLVQHMRSHTGERPFKCKDCNKAFPSSTRLKRHAIIHTGQKPYSCEVCKKSFNRSSTLNVHSKIHTDERSHICQICNKGFIQAHTLRAHIVTHYSEEPKTQNCE